MTGDPAAEAAAWRDWQAEVRRRVFAAADAREAVEAAAEEQERLARLEARHDPAVDSFLAGMTGKPPRTVAGVLHDLAQVRDEPWFDPGAEPGSERNPVRLDSPPAAVERSARTDASYDDVIRRYHEMGAEVERIIARHRRPRQQVRRESGTGWPDITRTCAGDGTENYGASSGPAWDICGMREHRAHGSRALSHVRVLEARSRLMICKTVGFCDSTVGQSAAASSAPSKGAMNGKVQLTANGSLGRAASHAMTAGQHHAANAGKL